jgi:hypothetical protein
MADFFTSPQLLQNQLWGLSSFLSNEHEALFIGE